MGFFGGGGLKDPFFGLHTRYTCLLEFSSCKIGWEGGLDLTSRAQKTIFSAKKLAFLGHFCAKNGHFVGAAALNHPFPVFHALQHMSI